MTDISSPRKINTIAVTVATQAIAEYQAALPLNKVDATAPPSGTDNFAAGYSINSRWIDIANDEAYVCVGDGVWQHSTAELASEVIYDPTGTALVATTAQAAITEVEGRLISDIDATDLTDSGDSTLHYHASDRDRANHTGTQTVSTISDFDTEVASNTAVAANTAKVSADGSVTTHSDVTDAGSGAIITTDERTKLGYITVTLAIDLDSIASDVTANNAKVTNVTTDLSIGTVDAISVEIVSSDGTNAVIPLATGTLAGLMSAADKAKLDAIP
jgi:hypothetical protein